MSADLLWSCYMDHGSGSSNIELFSISGLSYYTATSPPENLERKYNSIQLNQSQCTVQQPHAWVYIQNKSVESMPIHDPSELIQSQLI